jgi:four helix bundle protein
MNGIVHVTHNMEHGTHSMEVNMNFHDILKLKMHSYVKLIYHITKQCPKNELYGVISQIRRSTLSIILNYIEGYARRKRSDCKIYKNFLEISYGSLKESKYLLFFSYEEKTLQKKNIKKELT